MTTPEIAQHLYLSENTVGTYRRRLMSKFDAHNVAQLISKAQWNLDEKKE
jgi:DNA-binding CsgD family transcriptional regulator